MEYTTNKKDYLTKSALGLKISQKSGFALKDMALKVFSPILQMPKIPSNSQILLL